ncbi:hypothetical protein NLI96_g2075 [Meripilus lineatus]|uniref:Uncharacterized protein n=1 Tax=Meripilus lineatus TaxID=2056292 RepID=A0AAD5VBQ0_9APHY|nr:hypothetical protein NLI96_g2075 [Physisporinus lineatus]
MATVENQTYSFEVFERPGKEWSLRKCREIVHELREFASPFLIPLPDYQCLSLAPGALDDKLLVIVRQGFSPYKIVAFTSSVLIEMPFLKDFDTCTTVLHGGLTCVSPKMRGSNLTIQLTFHVWSHMAQEYPEGFWTTNVAEVISSLGNFGIYTRHCYPHPSVSKPLEVQRRIAQEISLHHRVCMDISPEAVFDPDTFVFKGSNLPGSCFRKDTEDPRYHHRDPRETQYFKALLGRNEGNEVLQVAFLSMQVLLYNLATKKDKSSMLAKL